MKPLYREIAQLIGARLNCLKGDNKEWLEKHTEKLEKLVENHMPSGSGIDSGTKIDLDESTAEKLVFTCGYHHMNDGGYYDGWTEHKVIVTPSLTYGFNLRLTGKDRNQIKDYLGETYSYALQTEV